jgi:hypothetical protein
MQSRMKIIHGSLCARKAMRAKSERDATLSVKLKSFEQALMVSPSSRTIQTADQIAVPSIRGF